jgi:hypothetical protein
MVFEDAPQKLTRQDILDEWPEDFDKPNPATLWKWLARAVKAELVLLEGTGRKADPFRYWIPQTEARWRADPFYETFERLRQELKLPFESLGTSKAKSREDEALPPPGGDIWPPGAPLDD